MVLDKEGLTQAFKVIYEAFSNGDKASLSLEYDVDNNLTCTLKDSKGNVLSTSTVKYPIDNLITSISKTENDCTFTFLDSSTVTIPIAEIADWAKASEKPTYTASEVGADASGAADAALASAKEYTDTKVSSVYKYKGSLGSLEDISAISSPTVGDVYNAEDSGMNYAWTGESWDALGSTIDLTDQAKTSDLATVALTANYYDLYNYPSIDSTLSTTSANAVSNATITEALNETVKTTDTQINGGDYSQIKTSSKGGNLHLINADKTRYFHIDGGSAGNTYWRIYTYDLENSTTKETCYLTDDGLQGNFIGNLSGNATTATTASRIQVLSADPSSPATGEIWIIDS